MRARLPIVLFSTAVGGIVAAAIAACDSSSEAGPTTDAGSSADGGPSTDAGVADADANVLYPGDCGTFALPPPTTPTVSHQVACEIRMGKRSCAQECGPTSSGVLYSFCLDTGGNLPPADAGADAETDGGSEDAGAKDAGTDLCPDLPAAVVLNCQPMAHPCGRHTEGAPRAAAGSGVAEYLAAMTHLESVSVHAFRRIAQDLQRHGAPLDLVRWAERCALEEERHVVLAMALSAQYGALSTEPSVPSFPARSLLDLAIENAQEGCVLETFGAALAGYQAQRAGDNGVRAVFSQIAVEEARHASFSWAMHQWLLTQLPEHEQALVLDCMREARDSLRRNAMQQVAGDVTLGLPATADRLAMFRVLDGDLFAPALAA